MIVSFGNSDTKKFAETGKSKFRGLDEELASQRLIELDAATKLADLGSLNSVGLHKLNGPLSDYWSIDVNDPWRVVFVFRDGNAEDVMIMDTH